MKQPHYHFEAQNLVNHLYRQWYGKMVASLTRYFGLQQIEVAEDLVQETFVAAIDNWSSGGLPNQPVNWLFKVCKNKTVNWLQKRRFASLPQPSLLNSGENITLDNLFLDHEIEDSQLRMMLASCHSSFSVKNQLIFVLRHVAGLTVRQIARGLLMTEEAVAKSIVRSRQLIREKELTFPAAGYHTLKQKLQELHLILYLMFNEGYAATEGNSIVREELCFEAIRLMKLVVAREDVREADSYALLALFLLHAARFPAREDTEGKLVDLEAQDRSLWDQELIRIGQHYFRQSAAEKNYSKYQVEAAIAYEHAKAASFEETDWSTILELYTFLAEREPSPTILLNGVIALYYSNGPAPAFAKLAELEKDGMLTQNQYYFSLLGRIYMALDDTVMAATCFRQAIELSTSLVEKQYLERLLATL